MRALALAATLLALPAGASESVAAIATRPGVTVRAVVVESATRPAASVILFAGGAGAIRIPDDDVTDNWLLERGNFLVRARRLFAERGFFVVVPDVPSDRSGLRNARLGDAHMADIAALIAFAKTRAPGAPVWLVGTSMGTVSAAQGAAAAGHDIAGLVLTSPVTESGRALGGDDSVVEARLGAIAVPSLIVAHREDACHVSTPAGARALQQNLTGAKPVAFELIEGGLPPRSSPCEAMSAHGYLGVERETVDAIANFIRANGARD
jgi:pimeloyl-ACP methyl ester carboxylesterase